MKKNYVSLFFCLSILSVTNISAQYWALNSINNNIYNSNTGSVNIGNGVSRVTIGSAYGINTGYGLGYIAFNAVRLNTAGTWSTLNDGGHNGGAVIYSDVNGSLLFSSLPHTGAFNQSGVADNTVLNNNRLFIASSGEIGINTRNVIGSGYKLLVNGAIRAKRVLVETGWSDFVFEKKYKLLTLQAVEKYIKTNNHLPGIPAANEVEARGADLGNLVKLQMQKIEELTLYIIDQDKRIKALEKNKIGQ